MAQSSAASQGLVGCQQCGLVQTWVNDQQRCLQCDEKLSLRKSMSQQRALCWLLAAMVIYIPANVLPIMTTSVLGNSEGSTIIGGVMVLIELQSYGVAAVVFIASIIIPIIKFIILSFILWRYRKGSSQSRLERNKLYRFIEWIGRWSMIDVFVVAILAALVQLGAVANITPGLAAGAFAITVVFTMLASHAIDPRLIWDDETEDYA